jgi:hypothetical protein
MSLRRMNSKYNSRCKRCHGRITVGSPIYWSKATGAVCPSCAGSEPASQASEGLPAQVPAEASKHAGETRFSIDWADLKEFCQSVWKQNNPPSNFIAANKSKLTELLINVRESWTGYSRGQAERWTTEGYPVESLKGMHEFMPPIREKRRLQFVEDGDEFHLDLAQSGYDNYMSSWTKREVIPGVRVTVFCSLYAGVSAKVTNDFNRWVCQMIYSLETVGVDAEVNFSVDGTDGPARGIPFVTTVRVKKEGEATDFLSFSPMLSPAGFRLFSFAAITLHAQANGHAIPSGIGKPATRNKWTVEVNKEDATLEIKTPWNASEFPAEQMTRDLQDAIKSLRSN